MPPAHIVLFALHSAVKLGGQAREAYVDAARGRELLLPLPNFNPSPGIAAAIAYFTDAAEQVAGPPRLLELIEAIRTNRPLSPAEQEELKAFHSEHLLLDAAERTDGSPASADLDRSILEALVTVRQWRRGSEPNPSALQRLAGSFLEIGIDYFSQVPGALRADTREGRALLALFQGFDAVRFATEPLGSLPGKLMVSTLEVVGERSEAFCSDPRVREIIAVSTSTLARNVHDRIEAIRAQGSDSLLEERVRDWAELVFRTLLDSGGRLAVQNPHRYLGLKNERQAVLASATGEAVLDFILDHDLDQLFSREALDTLLQAALRTVGEHPGIFLETDNRGLIALLGATAQRLSRFESVLTPDILPELTRSILEKTGQNLPLLWPDLDAEPEGHVLLQAAAATLEVLTRPAPGNGWSPSFSREDLLRVAETVLQACAEEPGWLIQEAGRVSPSLAQALEASFTAIQGRADLRLNPATAAEILQAAFLAVGSNAAYLERVPEGRRTLQAVLEIILGTLFDPALEARAAWVLLRQEVMLGLVRVGLSQLARTELSPEHLSALQEVLEAEVAALQTGRPWSLDAFEHRLEAALSHA